jgi:hypothetical protein
MKRIIFDTRHLYYMTQFLPVYEELLRRGVECDFVVYSHRPEAMSATRKAFRGLPVRWVETKEESLEIYKADAPDWVIFGAVYRYCSELPERTRSAQLHHGIGMKAGIYGANTMRMDVRFTEGPHYTRTLSELIPPANLVEDGYPKIDPLFRPPGQRPEFDLEAAGLDPAKPTLMYAPTFYPTCFPLMSDAFPEHFSDCNIIVKGHEFSYFRSRYRGHRRKMQRWAKAPNVHVVSGEEYNAVPYLAVADLLISDASAILFEFAAQDRPVVWCDFIKLRWTYRGPFRYRFERRMDSTIHQYEDICAHAPCYKDLRKVIDAELANPGRYSEKRKHYTRELIGQTDGRTAERIADYLLSEL